MADKNFKVRNGLETPLIAAEDGTTAITLNNNDVTIAGDLTVTGGQISGPGGGGDLVLKNASTIVFTNDYTQMQTDAGTTKAYFNNLGGKYTFNGTDSDNTNNYNLYSHGTLGSLGNTTVGNTLFLKGSTSGSVGLKGAAAAGSTTYTLPSADGTNGQVLSTNGTGTLSWATSGGGSTIKISNSGTIAAQPYSLGPGVLATGGTFATLTTGMAQTIRYQPIYVTEACTLTEVAFYVQTATTLASCSAMIYIEECSPNSATEWQPTGHLSGGYCGEVANITTTGTKTITGLSISLTPGAYLIAIQISNYTGTLGLRYIAGQVFTGGGYVIDIASGTTSAQSSFGRTGITYVSGTPAAVGDFTVTTPTNIIGQGYIVFSKFAKV